MLHFWRFKRFAKAISVDNVLEKELRNAVENDRLFEFDNIFSYFLIYNRIVGNKRNFPYSCPLSNDVPSTAIICAENDFDSAFR